MLCSPKHGNWSNDLGDRAGIKPKDQDSFPIYARDTELYTGTLNEIRVWLNGFKWARDYDMMLKLSDEKKRIKKEDEYRHREMLRKLAHDHTKEELNPK